jgi:hypothetical protein
MDNKKFETLIDLIINENEEQARALFHDIVVEKSREIYEGMMEEEMNEMGGGQVGGLLDEIDAEEQGMTEEEDEFADIDDGEGEEVDLDGGDFGDEEGGEGDLEDRVVDIEDKLDELMAEFEEIMGGSSGEEDMGGEEDFGGEEDMGGEEDFGDEEMMEAADDEEDDEEDTLEESVQLQSVKNVTHGDNGANTKSPLSKGPKMPSNGASAANLNKGYQDSGKGGTQGGVLAPTTKDVKGAGSFKNAPGAKFSEKGEAAPKAKAGDNGQNTKSITSESRKTTKRIVK